MSNITVTEITGLVLDKDKEKPLIIASKANDIIVSRLIDGAIKAFASMDINAVTLLRVHGALEIPLALKKTAALGHFTSFVVLGAVIKGETDHYDHVARMANDGVVEVALAHQLALGNGILTVHSFEQALKRADGPNGNLGFDAALAAINLSQSFNHIDKAIRGRL